MGRPDEAIAAPAEGEAPPPYEETYHNPHNEDTQWSPEHAPPYDGGLESRPTSGARLMIPPSLNAYFQWKFTRTFHLGEKKEEPLFAVRPHSGISGKPELVLYEGLDDNGPVLATGTRFRLNWSLIATLTIPAHEGVGHDIENQSVEMQVNNSGLHTSFRFAAGVGRGKKTRREQFEWRSSHGTEVKDLHGYKGGWKLVRLSNPRADGGGDRASRASGSSSDGYEVVAAWAYNSSMSMTKLFKFQLMGSALTGELGNRGAAIALISAMMICLRQFNQTVAVGAVGAA
ncbi:hypothetical protein GGR50DRAFT_208047 [Xylaria sp. CBS 124048]|nr:hypothetical protein GGR50DRAFT_208047 [Xylaria sp. CBS 124048]